MTCICKFSKTMCICKSFPKLPFPPASYLCVGTRTHTCTHAWDIRPFSSLPQSPPGPQAPPSTPFPREGPGIRGCASHLAAETCVHSPTAGKTGFKRKLPPFHSFFSPKPWRTIKPSLLFLYRAQQLPLNVLFETSWLQTLFISCPKAI